MKLPNGDRAIVDIRKLRDYCLNPNHPDGKHKARVFKAALGITRADADELRDALLEAARAFPAVRGLRDSRGQRYRVDFELARGSRRATIRSAWIIPHDEETPSLTTCYVLKRRR
jgi:hypothetical protein